MKTNKQTRNALRNNKMSFGNSKAQSSKQSDSMRWDGWQIKGTSFSMYYQSLPPKKGRIYFNFI